jgi:hypothetical protein
VTGALLSMNMNMNMNMNMDMNVNMDTDTGMDTDANTGIVLLVNTKKIGFIHSSSFTK